MQGYRYVASHCLILVFVVLCGCGKTPKHANIEDSSNILTQEIGDAVREINESCPYDEDVYTTMIGAELDFSNNLFVYKYEIRESPAKYHIDGFRDVTIKELQHNLDSIGISRLESMVSDQNSKAFLNVLSENNYGLEFRYVGRESNDTAILVFPSEIIKSLLKK